MAYAEDYRNPYLDKVVAAMVAIVFCIALFFMFVVVFKYWFFFKLFFAGAVVLVVIGLVILMYSVIWRFNAKTASIYAANGVPLQINGIKKPQEIEQKPIIHRGESPAPASYDSED